jgi:hypothetical protein
MGRYVLREKILRETKNSSYIKVDKDLIKWAINKTARLQEARVAAQICRNDDGKEHSHDLAEWWSMSKQTSYTQLVLLLFYKLNRANRSRFFLQ